jgi:hypothetical protein
VCKEWQSVRLFGVHILLPNYFYAIWHSSFVILFISARERINLLLTETGLLVSEDTTVFLRIPLFKEIHNYLYYSLSIVSVRMS